MQRKEKTTGREKYRQEGKEVKCKRKNKMEKKERKENRKRAEEDLKEKGKRKKESYVEAGRVVLVTMYAAVLLCEV